MANRFATFMIFLFVLVVLLPPALPQHVVDPQVHTLYIGFDFQDDPNQAIATIDRVAETVHFGMKPPFVPVCVVEARRTVRKTMSIAPLLNTTLGSWSGEDRLIVVRLIDGEDRDGALRYWHFPAENEGNTKDPFAEDIEQQVKDMGLPDGIGDSFSQRLNATYGIGDRIEPTRRDQMVSLAIEAMRSSEFVWAGEMLQSRQATLVSRSSTGHSGLIVYAILCVFIAGIAAVLTWFRLANKGEGEDGSG